ncbi:S-adenosylmethionine-dependent methyltransferase, YraL family [Neisseria sp. oral taxon 020 str. F0370]|uniref:16S rRNA (cytidine(1402)-2'-O)-methyltransferase n=1 Tax=unclassified Neisseria TaxID=2623750 RepID=UPI0002A4244F|nr:MULTISPECIES: 16S rRNA (cytidine(1402)-2'-O)-methyltransferase [unclassified Neisseria]ASP16524.1 16S rRNA (cytidine(1402)-2'-O)-methyltransferase [Neisseria sp. KEM232]EKY10595.1 S-adenosylmethionine-dependent methyltransferase, YraL family [Neisseria sp. oral taxon 020 str. F0370]
MLQKHLQKAADSLKSALYVVATPIGNLADITLRALAVLQRADLVCAEDTRVTARLLAAYGIQTKLLSVREHNERQMAEKIVSALSDGLIVAQVSDAGTPAVCDPGARLAEHVRAAGFKVVPVPGASAVMAALSAAGVAESDFYFSGFLPPKSAERKKLFDTWQAADYPIVMFETPHRIEAALADMAAAFPERRLALARELTKTFETFLSGTVADIQMALREDANQTRGEMVFVLHPAAQEKSGTLSDETLRVLRILADELPTKQAAALTAQITGEGKKILYEAALALKQQ